MFSQITNRFLNAVPAVASIVEGFWKIVGMFSSYASPEREQALQNLEDKKKVAEALKSQHENKSETVNALLASSKVNQQELNNATALVEKKLTEKQLLIEKASRLSAQVTELSIAAEQIQERNVADLELKKQRKQMEAELLKPSDHFQQLLNNAKLIEQKDYKQKIVPKVKSKQEILEEKKISVENLKLQQQEKSKNLEALIASSKAKQQELERVTLLVDKNLAKQQFSADYAGKLSAQINRLAIKKQIEERTVADLTLKIERQEMEAELLKPSETFSQLLENTKLIGQKSYQKKSKCEASISIEPELAIFQEPVIDSSPVVFAAPKRKNNIPVATAASFREEREKKQTDFFMHTKPKSNNKKRNKKVI